MATRSRIGIENENGTVTSIYCHWDGYPENNGAILLEHYTDREKVQKLIDLGPISSLAPEIDAPEGHTFETPVSGVVVAYHRDRGESFQNSSHRNIQSFFNSDIEAYGYVFNLKGEWLVKHGYSKKGIMPQLLTRVLSKEEYLITG